MSAGDLPRGGRDLRRCRRSRRRRRDLHRDEPKLFRRRGRPRGQLPLPPGQPARLNSTRCGEVGGALPTLVPGRDQSRPLPRAPARRFLCSIYHATTRTANDAPPSRRGPRNSYPGTTKKAWWRCPRDLSHVWQAIIDSRNRGRGCSKCSHLTRQRLPPPGRSLAERLPELARQWHATKNDALTPADLSVGSNRKVWWQCPMNRAHRWAATVCSRSSAGTGCPECYDASRRKRASRGTEMAAPDPVAAGASRRKTR